MRFRLFKSLGLFGLTLGLIGAAALDGWSQVHHHPSAESPSLFLFLVIGLVGSGHCIGMCGPFVMGYTQSDNNHWSAHFLYGLGRSTTYALMGLVVSSFGKVLQSMMGFRAIVLLIAGVLMVYLALAQLKLFKTPSQAWFQPQTKTCRGSQ